MKKALIKSKGKLDIDGFLSLDAKRRELLTKYMNGESVIKGI